SLGGIRSSDANARTISRSSFRSPFVGGSTAFVGEPAAPRRRRTACPQSDIWRTVVLSDNPLGSDVGNAGFWCLQLRICMDGIAERAGYSWDGSTPDT